MDKISCVRQIQGRLHAGNAGAHDHHCAYFSTFFCICHNDPAVTSSGLSKFYKATVQAQPSALP
jgi:hypothetical protein